jgi:hypothetical protein
MTDECWDGIPTFTLLTTDGSYLGVNVAIGARRKSRPTHYLDVVPGEG